LSIPKRGRWHYEIAPRKRVWGRKQTSTNVGYRERRRDCFSALATRDAEVGDRDASTQAVLNDYIASTKNAKTAANQVLVNAVRNNNATTSVTNDVSGVRVAIPKV